ncbi:RNA polymerase sigma factor SigZ [Aliivibrio finisterrensis]|uniref:RNA polymerase sigma factor SigZ n=1 Tax=Aliivibrio finisterrensis TaxID=511998 RepID=A0A4Q5KHB2_9GAMM|nr:MULTISPECIES: RNA polymerase sigma factor SigZ [Aliivibrio]MDD9176294.1 RNA polymerase sigma factor SigZ [Aliivibrio sp. S3TY1]MDD9193327.1 RNA polymerase sigma factor SigZ [Aliivibrio sp. S2TY2]RYU45539.1 RNA polymerase sigma factor SigZ [Aliivibrio finisterrensis]
MLSEWQNHKAQLRSYVYKRVDDASAVDDILQDVYIKASSNLHQLKSQGSLKGWLYKIAYNTIMDFYRDKLPYDELPEDLVAEDEDTVEEARKEMAECIRPLIDELPDKYRIPLCLAELEGVPQQEIADKLGLSLSGAKSRIQRGRVKFRENLMACCDFEINDGGLVTGYSPKKTNCSSHQK